MPARRRTSPCGPDSPLPRRDHARVPPVARGARRIGSFMSGTGSITILKKPKPLECIQLFIRRGPCGYIWESHPDMEAAADFHSRVGVACVPGPQFPIYLPIADSAG